jgi:hypothetical protein
MRVRVKEGCTGFFGNKTRKEGDEFEIKTKTHSTKTDDKGDPVVISEDQQFSKNWMERIDKPRAKPGPKPKAKKVEK